MYLIENVLPDWHIEPLGSTKLTLPTKRKKITMH